MSTHSVTIKSHLKALSFHIIGTCLMAAVIAYFEYDSIVMKVFGAFWVALTIPTLFLHVTYFIEDRYKTVMTTEKRLVIDEKSRKEVNKSFEETTSIVISCSKNIKDFGIPQLPIESYYYLTFNFIDGSRFVCTNLIFSSIKEVRRTFIGIPIMYKYALYNDMKTKNATSK